MTAISELAETRLAMGAIDRLVSRGLVLISTFTPTDAVHILEKFNAFDTSAAQKAGKLMARQRSGSGKPQAEHVDIFAQMVLDQLAVQSGLALIDAVNAHENNSHAMSEKNPVLVQMIEATLKPSDSTIISTGIRFHRPLIALGASAGCYYPAIAKAVNAELIVPENADVAGAIGAAVGSIRQTARVTITQPSEGTFRVHLMKGPADFTDLEQALEHAKHVVREDAEAKAKMAGGHDISIETARKIDSIDLGGGKTLFIEAIVSATASAQMQ